MTFRVILQPRAQAQLEAQYQHIAQQKPETAPRWFRRFVAAPEGLSKFPERCAIAPESKLAGREVRQLLFGKRGGVRRAHFVNEDDVVRILCIRHSARADASAEELTDE